MDRSKKNKLLVLAGPTAVGKTGTSIEIAKRFQCPIFSADSRQLYREMHIGTAKPDKEEMQGLQHYFIGSVSIHEKYDVGTYEKEVLERLSIYYSKNQFAILTGGTGLYIKAVCDGLDTFPDIDESVAKKLADKYKEQGLLPLQQELKSSDPVYYAKVDIQNPHRLIRALAVIKSSGKPYSSFLSGEKKEREFDPIYIFLNRDREELYQRINVRVDRMVNSGLIEEARALYPHKDLKSMQTVGYQELFDHFDGKCTREEAIEQIKQNSRRYAKRQLTWFRRDERYAHFHPDDVEGIVGYVEEEI